MKIQIKQRTVVIFGKKLNFKTFISFIMKTCTKNPDVITRKQNLPRDDSIGGRDVYLEITSPIIIGGHF